MNGPVLLAWGRGGSLGLGVYVWMADGVWGVSAEAGFKGVATVWSILMLLMLYIKVTRTFCMSIRHSSAQHPIQ